MFSLQEILSSPMLSALAQPSISTPPQNFGVPFNAQLYMFMNAHLQNMFTSLQRNNKVKEEVEENEEHKTQCSFSIDNLLRPESEEKQVEETIALSDHETSGYVRSM
ncbi:hypothetical protein RB195_006725 [Necator americanus]|uniref:Uncharacterized protein n=1 Tax=Necator americanus TaxID=51031 RepID=A0ABR1BTY0_NECAM